MSSCSFNVGVDLYQTGGWKTERVHGVFCQETHCCFTAWQEEIIETGRAEDEGHRLTAKYLHKNLK